MHQATLEYCQRHIGYMYDVEHEFFPKFGYKLVELDDSFFTFQRSGKITYIIDLHEVYFKQFKIMAHGR